MQKRTILALAILGGCQGLPGGVTTPSTYFPFIEGGKWTYNILSNTTVLGTLTETQSLVTTKDGVTTVHLRLNGTIPLGDAKAQSQFDSTLQATGSALFNIDDKGTQTQLLALPLDAGKTWTVNDAQVVVSGHEDVSVPAGAYRNALVVHAENNAGVARAWLAEGTGVVRVELDPKNNGAVLKAELSEFKPNP